MEGDEGTYTCNVMILDASAAQSIELQSLTGGYFKLEINKCTYLKVTVFIFNKYFAKLNKFLHFVFHLQFEWKSLHITTEISSH